MSYSDGYAILNTTSSINPLTNEGEYGGEDNVVHHIMQKFGSGSLSVWSGSSSTLSPYFDVDTRQDAHADQSGRYLGTYRCIGYISRAGGKYTVGGHVPSKKIKHYVFK